MRASDICIGLREAEGVLSDCLRYAEAGELGGGTIANIEGAARYVRALLDEFSMIALHEGYVAGHGMEAAE